MEEQIWQPCLLIEAEIVVGKPMPSRSQIHLQFIHLNLKTQLISPLDSECSSKAEMELPPIQFSARSQQKKFPPGGVL
jgi:hypothetical protein